jgi:hypothetical protein
MESRMKDQYTPEAKEVKRKEQLKAEEAAILIQDEVRKKAYRAKEVDRERSQQAKETQRAELRTNEDIKDLAKEKARKAAYFAKEKAMDEAQEARKAKENKEAP